MRLFLSDKDVYSGSAAAFAESKSTEDNPILPPYK